MIQADIFGFMVGVCKLHMNCALAGDYLRRWRHFDWNHLYLFASHKSRSRRADSVMKV